MQWGHENSREMFAVLVKKYKVVHYTRGVFLSAFPPESSKDFQTIVWFWKYQNIQWSYTHCKKWNLKVLVTDWACPCWTWRVIIVLFSFFYKGRWKEYFPYIQSVSSLLLYKRMEAVYSVRNKLSLDLGVNAYHIQSLSYRTFFLSSWED